MTRLILRVDEWPETDRAMWAALTRRVGLLDEAGALSHLRPISLEKFAVSYGRWLGWLRSEDPGALALEPAARATGERMATWMRSLARHTPVTRLTYVEQALRVVKAHRPDADWSAHRRLLRLLRREVSETPSVRKKGRIVSSVDLLETGLRLMNDGGAKGPPETLASAKRRRDGMMLAFLALLPLRRRNFCALELGRSIIVLQTGFAVHLEGEDTKSGAPWEAKLPVPLEGPLRRYLAEVRPWLMERRGLVHARLWVNDFGHSYTDAHLGTRIADIVRRHLGVGVPPHLFRDAAATTLAHYSPQAARLTRGILGHNTFRTAEKHYNHARTIEAGRRYSELVETLKERS
ncbi:MAG: hypothetical protein ACN6IW_00365 [Paracoccaceae bacterium]